MSRIPSESNSLYYLDKWGALHLYERDVRGLPVGRIREVHLIYTVHRIYCHHCHERSVEVIPFLSHPKASLCAEFERMILELRKQVSIRALTKLFHLRWHTVKDIEKRHLVQRFAAIDTSKVRAVGIDEIHIGHGQAKRSYLTIIRDLETGAVIHVGNGKGVSALDGALSKLSESKLQIVSITNRSSKRSKARSISMRRKPGCGCAKTNPR